MLQLIVDPFKGCSAMKTEIICIFLYRWFNKDVDVKWMCLNPHFKMTFIWKTPGVNLQIAPFLYM